MHLRVLPRRRRPNIHHICPNPSPSVVQLYPSNPQKWGHLCSGIVSSFDPHLNHHVNALCVLTSLDFWIPYTSNPCTGSHRTLHLTMHYSTRSARHYCCISHIGGWTPPRRSSACWSGCTSSWRRPIWSPSSWIGRYSRWGGGRERIEEIFASFKISLY